jgi:hypothetical protein
MTFTQTDGWQGPTILSKVLAAGPLLDCEVVALHLVLQRWSSIRLSVRDQFLSAIDRGGGGGGRVELLRLAVQSLS